MEGTEHNPTLREDLYRRRHPEGAAIPVLVQLEEIPDIPPLGEEITVEVWGLLTGWE